MRSARRPAPPPQRSVPAMHEARVTVLKSLARCCVQEWFAAPGGERRELEQIIYCALEKAELEGRLREQWQEWMRTEHARGSRASPPATPR